MSKQYSREKHSGNFKTYFSFIITAALNPNIRDEDEHDNFIPIWHTMSEAFCNFDLKIFFYR